MDIGAALATVTPAKAVVIHAVLSLLLFLLLRLPDDGQASLDGPTVHRERFVSPRVSREPLPSQPQGTHLAKERLQLVTGSSRPVRRRALLPSLGRLEVLESLLADTL